MYISYMDIHVQYIYIHIHIHSAKHDFKKSLKFFFGKKKRLDLIIIVQVTCMKEEKKIKEKKKKKRPLGESYCFPFFPVFWTDDILSTFYVSFFNLFSVYP